MHLLRPATPADCDGIWNVRYAVSENTLTPGRISNDELLASITTTGRGWVVEQAGAIQAFAIGLAASGNVWALFVHPQAQGRGFGSELHRAMLAWFGTQPTRTLWLSTGTKTQARRFYDKHGWHCVGPCGSDEVRYERPNAAQAVAANVAAC